ncbi:hypothetical protein ABIE27_005541 [Paenibacillus sp. 4624]
MEVGGAGGAAERLVESLHELFNIFYAIASVVDRA